MKQFTIPFTYRSPLLGLIKQKRKLEDKLKKDFSPYLLDFGGLKIYLARHFGFCYGVENAIEIAFRTVEENKGKRIFLLSEMIHNPQVNEDLLKMGVRFLQDTTGRQIIPFEELTEQDIVLIPAFGTTLEIEKTLSELGIITEKYNTTCPFVEKVWNRSNQIGKKDYTVIIHGKPYHEETRATFSHASLQAPTLVLKNMEETECLIDFISGKRDVSEFHDTFKGRFSEGFDPEIDLQRIGVVNQTTMLAADTQAIADRLKQAMKERYSLEENMTETRFADTRDTLCYATNDNQSAVFGMLEKTADLAIIVGGYNSSNTSHLVHLCEQKLPTYFISGPEKLLSPQQILHYNFEKREEIITHDFLHAKEDLTIMISSGASCPDSIVEKVIEKLLEFRNTSIRLEEMILTVDQS
jgi:4-hydroxy-3-methylbut-2-enyl diphosphate reductase